jgi:hypothetical protein
MIGIAERRGEVGFLLLERSDRPRGAFGATTG